eukprot:CAMPEP_0175017496 /NCGR_PEP_ID=MMETSP0005-20121125/12431_1 /TAXON_ID=420556 /ORGANISM="Ochromonas sp., Strain CCMP1393" /LENGTH=742 /DNA_ID=CAMNT_0016274919 /DNA_START=122 /DNA_END=2350 /DNA_ORIENTATION=+
MSIMSQDLIDKNCEYRVSKKSGLFKELAPADTNRILSLHLADITSSQPCLSATVIQKTNGPVPRAYLPSLLVLESVGSDSQIDESDFTVLVDACLQWYLDSGGRISMLEVVAPKALSQLPHLLDNMGFVAADVVAETSKDIVSLHDDYVTASDMLYKCDVPKYMQHAVQRINKVNQLLSTSATTEGTGDGDIDVLKGYASEQLSTLNDILGRLSHGEQDPESAIGYYTTALQMKPSSSAAFRNLGAAYHATGNTQMAFASYQQAVQVDSTDAQVYLKLAYFYEDFASKDWIDAEIQAQKCYQYYLDNVDPEDVSVLMRLANMLLRENGATEAVPIYDKILALDDTDHAAWFNRAHAQMKLKDFTGAMESFRRTLILDPTNQAAQHMVKSLDEAAAVTATSTEAAYVQNLFDSYSATYDAHVKKLLYSAPRVIRQELANVYKARYTTRGSDGNLIVDAEKIRALQETPAVLDAIADSIDYDNFDPDQCENPDKDRTITDFVPGASATSSSDQLTQQQQGGEEEEEEEEEEGKEGDADAAGVASSCSTYTSFMNRSLDILDLGCGTGLAGSWLKDYAKTLTGVDLNPTMLAVAQKKGLYDKLHEAPVMDFLQELQSQQQTQQQQQQQAQVDYDVVVSADLFAYMGELQPVFEQIATVMRSEGLFVFTVESVDNEASSPETSAAQLAPNGFRLLKSGRFGYTREYLDKLVASLGPSYETLLARDYSPRLENGEPTKGYLYIVQRN